MINFLGTLSKEEFLKDYWEKKPLLIKNAVASIESYATSEEIKELSYDEDFETRIVYNKNNGQEFSVKHGPLTASDFNQKSWTLICHNLNLLDENFNQLQKQLCFLPDWLFDDVMATHSPMGATIGAHIDKYNVFILQGKGQRKWQLQTNPDPTYIEGMDLKILKNFEPNIEWILDPGDMIYIPSNVAHQGTSLSESISYSIGLKSLEDETIIKTYLEDRLNHYESEDYLKDQTLHPVMDPYQHSPKITDYFFKKMQDIVANKEQFELWFNNFLSTPKCKVDGGEVYLEEEIIQLSKNHKIKKDIYTKMASLSKNKDFVVSINAQSYSLSSATYKKVLQWFAGTPFDAIEIDFSTLDNESWSLVIDLFKTGTFYFDPIEDHD